LSTGVQVIIDFASNILMMIASFLIVWSISQTLALTTLVVVPGVLFIAALFGTVGKRIMLDARRAYGRVSGQIAENLAGVHVAKAFNREDELSEKMSELNQEAYNYGFKFMMLMSAMQPLMRSIGQFAIAAVLFVGGSFATGTASALSVGELFVGITMTNRFMWPLLALAMYATQVQSSLAAMDRISDVTEGEPSITDSPESEPLYEQNDGIEFRNVDFSYVDDELVLKDVSFQVKPGETVAVVGHTGAGKTTVAALINRFYDPDSGKIFIGDQDLQDISLDSLHDEISLIPQEPYLFDGSVIENIRYGKPSATEEEIVELCKLIGADEFIVSLPDGYHTEMIQGGKNVSSGQKQMITIARTMLADPKILILDEATSRLDAYSESLVQDAQAKLFSGRTTVVIAHRLTTIANASRILVFEDGEIVERGTHEELLELGGVFKRLYDTYYAHQGIEELSESIASTAAEEVSSCSEKVRAAVAESGGANPGTSRDGK
jgi:ABC-type multidrug transport system fused ATPase/permease subunit